MEKQPDKEISNKLPYTLTAEIPQYTYTIYRLADAEAVQLVNLNITFDRFSVGTEEDDKNLGNLLHAIFAYANGYEVKMPQFADQIQAEDLKSLFEHRDIFRLAAPKLQYINELLKYIVFVPKERESEFMKQFTEAIKKDEKTEAETLTKEQKTKIENKPLNEQSAQPTQVDITRRQFGQHIHNIAFFTAIISGLAIMFSIADKRGIVKLPFGQQKTQLPECKETDPNKQPLFTILEKSLPIFLSETKTFKDNLLSYTKVTKYLLKDMLAYTGNEEGYINECLEKIARFSLIGDKSGYLLGNENGKDNWKKLNLAQAMNILIEVEQFDDFTLKQWICYCYKASFGRDLLIEHIHIKRSANKISEVIYSAPKDFDRQVRVRIVIPMSASDAIIPGGNLSSDTEYQQIISTKEVLILPSGRSPTHDLRIPLRLLRKNPTFTINFADTFTWELNASDLLESIQAYNVLQQTNTNYEIQGTAFSRIITANSIKRLIETNSQHMQSLVKVILKDISPQKHAEKIKKIVSFVQNISYIPEYDVDLNRPGLVVLFNGGGDCNNLVKLFAELMSSAGYDSAIIYTDKKKKDGKSHVVGGIPEHYMTPSDKLLKISFTDSENHRKRYIPIELTNKFDIGVWSDVREEIFAIEEIKCAD